MSLFSRDETASTGLASTDPEAQAEEAARPAGPAEHDESTVETLAAKIFVDWLRNRQQLLVPLALDLQKLEPSQVQMLVHAAASAAQADGTSGGADRERAESALRALNASDEQCALVATALEQRKPLAEVLSQVEDVRTGAIVYAASLLALDRRKLVNRHYLRYLAARLQLPKDLMRSVEQRYRTA